MILRDSSRIFRHTAVLVTVKATGITVLRTVTVLVLRQGVVDVVRLVVTRPLVDAKVVEHRVDVLCAVLEAARAKAARKTLRTYIASALDEF